MNNDVSIRQEGSLYQIYQGDKLIDRAPTEPDAQVTASRIRARIAHEALINERNELKEVVSILQGEITGYHERINQLDSVLSVSPTSSYLKDRTP